LLAKAITEPIPAPSCGTGLPFNGGPPCNTPVTATDLRFGVHASFRSDSDFPLFNLALDQALNGNASLFGYMPLEDIRESVVSPLLCSDFRMFSGFWSYFRVVNRALAMTDSQKTFDGFNNFSSNSQPVSSPRPPFRRRLICVVCRTTPTRLYTPRPGRSL
jgi:hypothetical protein